jgi:hypothetical protein
MERFPVSYQECDKIKLLTSFIIEKNKKLKVFEDKEFQTCLEKNKIRLIKNFLTKDKFGRFDTYVFFLKKCTLIEIFKILDVRKRIKNIFSCKKRCY